MKKELNKAALDKTIVKNKKAMDKAVEAAIDKAMMKHKIFKKVK